LTPSNIIKISNVHNREFVLTPEAYTELYEDMEDELSEIPHFKRIKVIRNGEERLGAEVGCIFGEFNDKKSSQVALNLLKGRIYDGNKIHVCFIDEGVYFSDLYVQ
jgi:hypothetical protein